MRRPFCVSLDIEKAPYQPQPAVRNVPGTVLSIQELQVGDDVRLILRREYDWVRKR
jgi:hypothetical protein